MFKHGDIVICVTQNLRDSGRTGMVLFVGTTTLPYFNKEYEPLQIYVQFFDGFRGDWFHYEHFRLVEKES